MISAVTPRLRLTASRQHVRRATIVGVILLTIAFVMTGYWIALSARGDSWIDFRSYQSGAERLLAGYTMYAPDQLAGPYELAAAAGHVFVYPPSAMLLIFPFAATGAVAAWLLLEAAVFASGLLAVLHRADRLTPAWAGVVLLASVVSVPFIQALAIGNTSMVIAGFVGWAYAGRAGLAGAGGVLLKTTPGAIAVMDGWRGARTAMIAAVPVVFVSIIIFGPGSWVDFAHALGNAQPECAGFTSIACLAAPAVGMAGAKALTLAVAAGLAIAALAAPSRLVRLALVTGSLLAATTEIQWPGHYWLMAYPLVVVVAVRVWARIRG